MSATVNPVETDFIAGTQALVALAANPARAYLQIQNQSAAVVTYKIGSAFNVPANGVQKVSFDRVPTGGTWTLTFKGQTTTALAYNADATAVQNALIALSSVGGGNVSVTGDYTVGFTITFISGLANSAQPLMTLGGALTDNTAASNAVQAVNFDQPPTAGAFVLAFKGEPTASLPFDISAAALRTALNILGNVNNGVSASAQDGVTKNFSVTMGAAPLASAAQPLLTLVSSTLTGTANQASQVQKLYATPVPTSGTFKLSNGIDTTAALAYNISAGALQTALRAMPSIGAGNLTVTGTSFVAGFTLTYGSGKANSVVPALFVVERLLQSQGLDDTQELELDEIDPQDVYMTYPVTVTGRGADNVAVTFATTTPGGASASVQKSIVLQVAGQAGGNDGVDLQVGGPGALFDAECPTGALYLKAAADSSAVTILEG